MIIEVKCLNMSHFKSIPCHQYMDITYSETVPFIIALIKYFVKEKNREIDEEGEQGWICQVISPRFSLSISACVLGRT